MEVELSAIKAVGILRELEPLDALVQAYKDFYKPPGGAATERGFSCPLGRGAQRAAFRPHGGTVFRTPRSGQVATALMGVIIFFDDYANTLIVGKTLERP